MAEHDSNRIESRLRDRTIIGGLTGGIACYKVGEVVSRLAQAGCSVTVVMTEAATRFVAPLTYQALSGRPVYSSPFVHIESHDPQHVSLARAADLMVIAPCTMDMMAKLVIGRTDDAVSLICSAVDRSEQPVLLAPSMNAGMWTQPSTQRNLSQLRSDGFQIVGPGEGWQACRTTGPGRMAEPAEILARIAELLESG